MAAEHWQTFSCFVRFLIYSRVFLFLFHFVLPFRNRALALTLAFVNFQCNPLTANFIVAYDVAWQQSVVFSLQYNGIGTEKIWKSSKCVASFYVHNSMDGVAAAAAAHVYLFAVIVRQRTQHAVSACRLAGPLCRCVSFGTIVIGRHHKMQMATTVVLFSFFFFAAVDVVFALIIDKYILCMRSLRFHIHIIMNLFGIFMQCRFWCSRKAPQSI